MTAPHTITLSELQCAYCWDDGLCWFDWTCQRPARYLVAAATPDSRWSAAEPATVCAEHRHHGYPLPDRKVVEHYAASWPPDPWPVLLASYPEPVAIILMDHNEKREFAEAFGVLARSLGISIRELMAMSRADLVAGASAAQELRDIMDRYPALMAEADTMGEAVDAMSGDDAARFRELNDRLQADAR